MVLRCLHEAFPVVVVLLLLLSLVPTTSAPFAVATGDRASTPLAAPTSPSPGRSLLPDPLSNGGRAFPPDPPLQFRLLFSGAASPEVARGAFAHPADSNGVNGHQWVSQTLVGKQVGPFAVPDVPGRPQATRSAETGWEGINSSDSDCSCVPPDVTLAVGPTSIVEMTNLEEMVWSETGAFVLNQSLFTFFGIAPTAGLEEPKVIYDNLSQTWYASLLDSSSESVLLAASESPDPLGLWQTYDVPAWPNEAPDQPYIGVSQWMLGISTNDVNLTTHNLDGTGYEVLNRSDLSTGVVRSFSINPQLFVPNGRAESSLTSSPLQWFGGYNPVNREAYWVNVTTAPPGAPTYRTDGGAIAALAAPPPAAQAGTSDRINTSDGRAISALWQNNLETLTFTTGSGCGATLSCLRLVQVWTDNRTVRQDLLIDSRSTSLYYPTASVDGQGDLSIVAGFSSNASYPSAYVFGEAWNEPGTPAQGTGTVVNGSAPDTTSCNAEGVCPYGEYFGAAPDPNSTQVWTASEFEETGTGGSWSTWIQSTRTAAVSLVASASPSAVDVGQASTFAANGSGGSSPLANFSWTGLPPGCSAAGGSTFTCVPSSPGTFHIVVRANDSYPRSASAGFNFTVYGEPTVSRPHANSPGADVGQTRTFNVTAAQGSGSYAYAWSGLPSSGCAGAITRVVICGFASAANLTIAVSVTDSLGGSADSAPLNYTISPILEVGRPSVETTALSVGKTAVILVSVSGGSGSDMFAWSGLPSGCFSQNASMIDCTPTSPGTSNVSVTVMDTNGASATSGPLRLTVTSVQASVVPGVPPSEISSLVGIAVVALGIALVAVAIRRRRAPNSTSQQIPAPAVPSAETPESGRNAELPPPPPPPPDS